MCRTCLGVVACLTAPQVLASLGPPLHFQGIHLSYNTLLSHQRVMEGPPSGKQSNPARQLRLYYVHPGVYLK